ncbi:MAG: hypothetical protein JWN34_4847 [Bryobacterales bacterium]|nr:hypothetical protein [Bryobacterales bacterium]
MPKTRSTLYYLATYLFLTGLALFLAPQLTLKMLMANHAYPGTFVQFSGVLMIGLAIVVANVILYGGPKFYRATLLARIPMWFLILGLYVETQETALVIVLGVLGLGILLTGSCYLRERGQAA